MAKTKKNVRTKKATAAYVAKMATIRENREQWLTALESGKYRQTDGQLRKLDGKNYGYCCLGVLCNLHKDKAHKWDAEQFAVPTLDFDPEWMDEDEKVTFLYDMPNEQIYKKVNIDETLASELASMNDNGKTFKEIAAFLRKKWRMPKA